MRNIRTIAYVSVALLIVSMLAIGAVSAKAGEGGNGGKMGNNGNCIGIGDCDRDRICDGECINTGVCKPKSHEYNYDYCNSES